MLNTNERGLPRRNRRALISKRRGVVQKRTPFGRTKVISFEVGEQPRDNRVVYNHFTKGLMDRRETMPLLSNLISVG